MIDVKVVDETRFAKEYAPGHAPALKAAGAFPEVVCSPNIKCLRGNAKPNFIVIHAWASTDAFKTFYNHGKCLVKYWYTNLNKIIPSTVKSRLKVDN